jgi:hypothetical protein
MERYTECGKAVIDGPVTYVMLQGIVGTSSHISVRETRSRLEVNSSLSLYCRCDRHLVRLPSMVAYCDLRQVM